jgi:hypothetical protein
MDTSSPFLSEELLVSYQCLLVNLRVTSHTGDSRDTKLGRSTKEK